VIASSPARQFAGLLLLLAFPTLLHAQAHGLEVRPAERELFTVEPRQVVTAAFTVRNATGRRAELEPGLVLPPGWRAITPELLFELANGETAVRLVSFMVPETAREGDYPVTYEVRDRQQPAVREAYTVRVRVLPLPKLQVLPLEMPEVVIAGESYQASFLIRNTGNAPMQVEFQAQSAQGGKADPQAGTLKLEPGESKNVAITVETPKLKRRDREHLTVTVKVPGTTLSDSANSATHIVPRISADDAYHNLAAQASLSYVSRDADGSRSSGWQTQFSGAGTLDEENTKFVSFMLRSPDTRADGSFGLMDEYWLDYKDESTALTLGDRTYGLSPLTELARYGRGARVGYEKKNWGLSGYELEDRFSLKPKRQTGVNAYYHLTPDTRVDANYLDKRDDLPGTVTSLRSQTQWAPGLISDVEHAQSEGGGERGQAIRGNFSDSSHPVRYYGTAWHAGPGFRGYFRDQQYVSLGFDYPRPGQWGLRGYYRLQDNNLNADPARAAPRERQSSLGTERTLFSATRVSLDYNQRTRVDRREVSEFDLVHRSVRASVGQPIQNLSLLYVAELGKTYERVKDASFNTSLHMLTAYWKATERQSYSAYVFRDDNAYSTERQGVQTTVGMNGSYNVSSTTLFNLNIQRGHASAGPTSAYNLSVSHQRQNGDRISLLARRSEGALRITDMMLAYSIPFALPVSLRADMSSLRGRILDIETGQGVPNVVLSLDGLAAVSGEKGEFTFPAVKAGSYQLSIDRANVGVGRVAVGKMPLEVVVAAHEPKQVELALVRSAALHIRVNLYPEGTAQGVARGAGNVLVTLRSADRVYRRLTDAGGSFRLAGLTPGRWIASIDDEALPEGYEAQSRELVLEVAPGGESEAEFRLTPLVRTIKMLPPLSAR